MPQRSIEPEDLAAFHWVSDPQMSPDGKQVLFTKGKVNDKNKVVNQIWLVPTAGGEPVQWTNHETGSGGGRWSPDGKQIAFVGGREKPAPQIYLISASGGEAVKLTSLPEGAFGEIQWSPDGTKIAFTFRETDKDHTAKAAEERKEKGLSPAPWVVDSLWYRLDGDGYFGNQRHKVYTVDLATKEAGVLYDKDKLGGYSFTWLPDSSGLLISHSVMKDPLLQLPNEQIFRIPLKGKATMLPGLEKGGKGMLRISPDGRHIAFMGDTDQEFMWGCRNSRVYLSPIEGGSQVALTESDDFCLEASSLTDTSAGGGPQLQWTPDGKKLRVSLAWHGTGQVGEIDVSAKRVKMVTDGRHILGVGTADASGKSVALTYADPLHLNEVAVLHGGKVKVLTTFNQELLDGLALSDPEEIWVETTDGLKVQAWVMKPSGAKAKKAHPAILEVHGGPHTQYGLGFFIEFQCLVAQGYVVVFSNPRGSKGYGEAWTSAIKGDWGSKDWDDVQAVSGWMKKQKFIDSGELGIMGGSYGGFMTNWAIGHSKEYKAAITDRCVSNWVSMAGNSDFPLNKDGYFGGNAWGPLKNLDKLWQQSPVSAFEKVVTPTLIIHSEGDLRCNVEQSEQVFYILKNLGVEAKFIRYPSVTSHGMSRNGPPDMRIHRLHAILQWWRRHLK